MQKRRVREREKNEIRGKWPSETQGLIYSWRMRQRSWTMVGKGSAQREKKGNSGAPGRGGGKKRPREMNHGPAELFL